MFLTYDQVAEQMGISTNGVKQLVTELKLLAVKREQGWVVPAQALDGELPVKHLYGVLHLLHDAGYGAEEMHTWLTTPDDSLPGTPFDALQENRATEVKRRAQALAF